MSINLKTTLGLLCLVFALSFTSCKSKKGATAAGGQKKQELSKISQNLKKISQIALV